jgi:hypothetical protein
MLYGNGADANGVTICASAAIALIANQTNLSWMAEFAVHCRSIGASGTLFGTGFAKFNPAVIASTAQPILIPASAPAVSGGVRPDLGADPVAAGELLRARRLRRCSSTTSKSSR